MRRSRLEIVKEEIFNFFDAQSHRVFTADQLSDVLVQQWNVWEIPNSTTFPRFANFLIEHKKLWMQRFDFLFHPVTLYFWGSPTAYEVAMSLRPRGYLSHLSAMQLNDLTEENKSRIIYVNDEQKPKPQKEAGLEQGRIDAAFQRRPRVSNNKVTVDNTVFYLLSGKHTDRLGVIEESATGIPVPIRFTSVERTLIDAVVRPAYSGSAYGVLEAYRRASGRVNVERLAMLLQQLQYGYPYHQAIGFYMEWSGAYTATEMEVFKRLPQEFKFYLDYEMVDVDYSENWRIYYPSYLKKAV